MQRDLDASRAPARRRLSWAAWAAIAAAAVTLAVLIVHSLAAPHGAAAHVEHAPRWWGLGILPFIGILGAIALLPLIKGTHHWWESNLHRLAVALACAAATLLYYLISAGPGAAVTALEHAIVGDYIPFIVLLFSLYVIAGGISLSGDLPAHPSTNTAFLALGGLIASFVGTTGASMLLIRPLLQTNSERRHVVHTVIFFIFIVSNVGGSLLPIGDPPLFLGYLRGVDFWWTLQLWPEWLLCTGLLLVVYFVWDTIAYRREAARDIRRDEAIRKPLRLRGAVNALWLAGVVAAAALVVPGEKLPLLPLRAFPFLRELLLLFMVALSLVTTPAGVRQANRFNYAAIIEVAALFVGIFVAMQVPIEVLRAMGPTLTDRMLTEPAHFFWATGTLSSFLDNAPTYVVFFELARTMHLPEGAAVELLADGSVISVGLLTAVSLGSVFMGAMTYIGNGPNFMVKAIAEQSGIRMPSFFGYMFKYSVPILIPLFALVVLLML